MTRQGRDPFLLNDTGHNHPSRARECVRACDTSIVDDDRGLRSATLWLYLHVSSWCLKLETGKRILDIRSTWGDDTKIMFLKFSSVFSWIKIRRWVHTPSSTFNFGKHLIKIHAKSNEFVHWRYSSTKHVDLKYLAEPVKKCILGILVITESELMHALHSLEPFHKPETRIEQRIWAVPVT